MGGDLPRPTEATPWSGSRNIPTPSPTAVCCSSTRWGGVAALLRRAGIWEVVPEPPRVLWGLWVLDASLLADWLRAS